MSVDPAQFDAAAAAAQVPPEAESDGLPIARSYIQITEVTAGPTGAAAALETRDAYGRVPVVVRIQRQAPIRGEFVLLAIGLGASGLLLPALLRPPRGDHRRGGRRAPGRLHDPDLPAGPGRAPSAWWPRAASTTAVLPDGTHWVNPILVLTHIVTTREIAFDVPVAEVRSSDGVGVSVDVLLTLAIDDAARFAYSITTGDLDQLVHAVCQDAVRTLVRGVAVLDALDLGQAAAASLRDTVDAKLATYGVDVRAVAFTRVTLPPALIQSLEARRLASVQLAEEQENFALDQRRLTDRARLVAQELEARRAAVEYEAAAEAVRLARLEERIAANPSAARYDLETRRLDVARALAGNTRAVVSLGGSDLVTNLLLAREAEVATIDGDAARQAPADRPVVATAPEAPSTGTARPGRRREPPGA